VKGGPTALTHSHSAPGGSLGVICLQTRGCERRRGGGRRSQEMWEVQTLCVCVCVCACVCACTCADESVFCVCLGAPLFVFICRSLILFVSLFCILYLATFAHSALNQPRETKAFIFALACQGFLVPFNVSRHYLLITRRAL